MTSRMRGHFWNKCLLGHLLYEEKEDDKHSEKG